MAVTQVLVLLDHYTSASEILEPDQPNPTRRARFQGGRNNSQSKVKYALNDRIKLKMCVWKDEQRQ